MKNTKKVCKVFSTSIIATMLTASLGMGIGNAQEITATESVVVENDGVSVTTSDKGTEVESEKEVEVLPGDLFYFFKALTEKIKLALTFEDYDKAKLLVQFTEDRLNEAEELLKNGDEDLAYSTLLKALELQGLALDYSNEQGDSENSNDSETSETTEEKSDTEMTSDDSNESEDEGIAEDESTTDAEENNDSNSETVDDSKEELEKEFSQNVHGLLIAIQNVKNPKALKALTKNLEKQTKKFEKRYGKILKEEIEYEESSKEIDEKEKSDKTEKLVGTEETSKVENSEKTLESVESTTTTKETIQEKEVSENTATVVKEEEVKKQIQEYKNEMKKYQEEVKRERELKREEMKREKEKMKEERKQKQHEQKKAKEEQRGNH